MVSVNEQYRMERNVCVFWYRAVCGQDLYFSLTCLLCDCDEHVCSTNVYVRYEQIRIINYLSTVKI